MDKKGKKIQAESDVSLDVGMTELHRYRDKGWGMIPSILIVFVFFYFVPPFVEAHWA